MLKAKSRYLLWFILAIALIARLSNALAQNPLLPYRGTGGDSAWYLLYGRLLVIGHVPAPPPSAPLYLIFVGFWQTILSPDAAIIAMRIIQCAASVATCYFAYRLGTAVTDDEHVGLVAAGVLAVSPVFVLECAQITTETLYLFFIAGGLWAYVCLVKTPVPTTRFTVVMIGIVAILFGLATLTRAQSLLFPVGLAIHWLLVKGRSGWRAGLSHDALLIAVYAFVVATWTVYNLLVWNYFVVGAQGMASFLYLGATPSGWTGPQNVDQQLLQQGASSNYDVQSRDATFQQSAAQAIGSDPLGWVRLRVGQLADAYFQPHGTAYFPGESLKDLAVHWLQTDRSLSGLLRLTQGDAFVPKLVIYVFHYAGLLLGLVGMVLSRRQWRAALPLIGFVFYTTLLHLVIFVIPRYIFPTEIVWWIFAALVLVRIWNSLEARTQRRKPSHQNVQHPEIAQPEIIH